MSYRESQMIKSQLLCQLSYAPACKGTMLRSVFIIASKNRPDTEPRDAAPWGAARMQPGNNNYSICTSCL